MSVERANRKYLLFPIKVTVYYGTDLYYLLGCNLSYNITIAPRFQVLNYRFGPSTVVCEGYFRLLNSILFMRSWLYQSNNTISDGLCLTSIH